LKVGDKIYCIKQFKATVDTVFRLDFYVGDDCKLIDLNISENCYAIISAPNRINVTMYTVRLQTEEILKSHFASANDFRKLKLQKINGIL